jgi:uncharacterized protein YegL
MSKKITHFVFVLDKSSSMASLAKDAVKTYNEYVSQMREQQNIDPDLETTVSLITFNDSVEEVLWRQPVDAARDLRDEDFRPGGTTALNDAMGYTINRCLTEDAGKAADDDIAYWLFLITDGEENSSRTYKMEKGSKLLELFEHCEKSEEWTLTVFGCAVSQLKQFGDIEREQFTSGKMSNVDYGAKGLYATAGGQNAASAVNMMYNARSAGGKFAMLSAAYDDDLTGDSVQLDTVVPVTVTVDPLAGSPVNWTIQGTTDNS